MAIKLLTDAIAKTNAPVVVGLDPQIDLLPPALQQQYGGGVSADMGVEEDFEVAVAKAFVDFNREIIDHIYDIVPAVKPQIAFYEMFGAAGYQAYIDTVAYAKSKGLVVIGDIKRGDIASTATAYSNGHLGKSTAFGAQKIIADQDFVTINPYMGTDSVTPWLADCKAYNRGLFILLKTSNPGSSDLQDVTLHNGKPLYAHVADLINKWGADTICPDCGFSQVGAVVGATHPAIANELRGMMPSTLFLVPGYGAQGGTGADLKPFFTSGLQGAIVNSSRGIIYAYQQGERKDYGLAAREATLAMIADIRDNV